MSFCKTTFLMAGLACSALLLASCAEEGKSVGKAKADQAPDPGVAWEKGVKPGDVIVGVGDASAFPNFDPGLPTSKTPAAKTSASDPGRVDIGSGLKKPDINKPKVNFDLPKIQPDLPIVVGGGKVVVPALKKQAAGMIEPKLSPQLVALTVVGGAGDQWIQEVGFTGDGKIYAQSGGGAITIFYSGDGGKFLEMKGDLKAPSTGPRALFDTRDNRAFRTTAPDGTKMAIGTTLVGKSLQPYLHAGEWKWWDASSLADLKGIDANTRGVRLWFLHDGKFLAKAVCDGASSSLTKDPREIKSNNLTANQMPSAKTAGPLTLYMAGAVKNGEPFYGTFLKGKLHAEAVDSWERLYVTQLPEGKDAPDAWKLGGKAGLTVLNNLLAETVWSTSLGADDIYCMALNHNILVIGGSIGQRIDLTMKTKAGLDPAKLRLINPSQIKPGGDEDGFLAIIKLW